MQTKVEVMRISPLKAADCPELTKVTGGVRPRVLNSDDGDDDNDNANANEETQENEGNTGEEAAKQDVSEDKSKEETSDKTQEEKDTKTTESENEKEKEKEKEKEEESSGGGFGFGFKLPVPGLAFGSKRPVITKDVYAPASESFLMSAHNLHCIAFNSTHMDLVPSVCLYLTVPVKKLFFPLGDYHESHCPETKLSVPTPGVPGLPFGGKSDSDEAPAPVQAPIDVVHPTYLPSISSGLPEAVVTIAKEAAIEEGVKKGLAPEDVPPNAYLAEINWLFIVTFGFPSKTAVAYADISVPMLATTLAQYKTAVAADGGADQQQSALKIPLRHITDNLLWNEIFDGEDVHIQLEPAEAAF